MREILFRGKSKESGYWVEGNYCFCCVPLMGIMDIPSIQTVSGDVFRYIAVSPETVGQFTGLTDKNGKRIFENDIVKVDDDDEAYKIIYVYGVYRICDRHNQYSYTIHNEHNYLTVIGNIYDNPELLKGD